MPPEKLLRSTINHNSIVNPKAFLEQWLTKGNFGLPLPHSTSRHLTMFGDISSCHNWKGNLLLASSGQGPRLLLNIPQCTGQAPTTQNYPAATVNSAAKMEKPPRKGESHDLPMLFHLEKSQSSNKQKEQLISSLLIQTLLKGTGFLVFLIKLQISRQEFSETTIFADVVK